MSMTIAELHKIVTLYNNQNNADKEIAVKVIQPGVTQPFVGVNRKLTGIDNLSGMFVIQTDEPVSKNDSGLFQELRDTKQNLKWVESELQTLRMENLQLKQQLGAKK
jgi:hypothetical protein